MRALAALAAGLALAGGQMTGELDEAFARDHLDANVTEMYGRLDSYDSGARLSVDTCDDATAGALRDIDERLINWGTASLLNARAMCNYQRFSAGGAAERGDLDLARRCAARPEPLVWERRACDDCANHVCIEHGIEYFVNQSDPFGSGAGGGVEDRTHLRVVRADTYPYEAREYPLYAPGEPPVADRHRPLWAAWGEYAYVGPQRWLHNLEHGAVVVLYDPCLEPAQVDRLRALVASLPAARDPALRRRMRVPRLARGGPKFVLSPRLHLGRAFAVLVWQAGLMSDCVASDDDLAAVRPSIEAFLKGHHGNTVEVRPATGPARAIGAEGRRARGAQANLTYSGRYRIGLVDEVIDEHPAGLADGLGALVWACGAATGAVAALAALGFWRWRQRFFPYKEITPPSHKGT